MYDFIMTMRITILPFCTLILSACGHSSDTAKDVSSETVDTAKVREFVTSTSKGKNLFAQHCTPCHISPDKHAKDAYTFDHIFDRYPDPGEQYFTKFIQDSKALKQSGDAYAKALDKDYTSDYEHHFIDTLTDQDIQDIIVFIKSTYL